MTPDRKRQRCQHGIGHGERLGGAGVDQRIDAVTPGERRAGDDHAEGGDQRPEAGFPPVPQGMLVVGRAAAATLSHEQGQVVGVISE